MPKATPSIKVKNVARLGAKIVLYGDDFDAAKSECMRLADSLGLVFVPPYDDPLVIAGQGTVAMEILKQTGHAPDLDAVFASVGGGGLIAGIGQYIRRIGPPNTQVIGVETLDGDAMTRSLQKGHRVLLSDVGPFSDGTAVKIVGEEPFRVCQHVVDSIVCVDTDAICAAIKDIFEETRSLTEPAGALALAGLKRYIIENKLVGANKKFVAVISGANINFDRLRFVAERAELGEGREALFTAEIPERPGSFFALHTVIHPRAVTEFCYRYSGNETAHIYLSFVLDATTPALRKVEIADIQVRLEAGGMHGRDISEDELAKGHARYLVGGRSEVPNERVFRFGNCLCSMTLEFPERPGALRAFLSGLHSALNWNISLFHYRNHGADIGKVLAGIQVPPAQYKEFDEFLVKLGYHYVEETDSSITTAEGSSLVRMGNTTVVCGVKAEIAEPELDKPELGFLVPNIDLPPLCSSRFKSGPPGEEAQILSERLNEVLISSAVVPLSTLCIQPGEAVWALYIDTICLNYDGNLFDAALLAIMAALKNTLLPKATYDEDARRTTCTLKEKVCLQLGGVPLSASFGVFDNSHLLADPTSFEEQLLDTTITVILDNDSALNSISQIGLARVGEKSSEEVIATCVAVAKKRCAIIRNFVNG